MSERPSPFDAIFDGGLFDPMEAAQRHMRADLPRRFWKEAGVQEADGLFRVTLDGRPARTPGKAYLASRHASLAQAMADEWGAVGERLDPTALPMTRLLNVAIDLAADARAAILDEVAAFGASDLLCYRAERPEGLVERQQVVWGGYLESLARTHGIRLVAVSGIMPATQPSEALDRLRARADAVASDEERLAALHLATTLTGSAVLALSLADTGADADAVWTAAHLDEDWNREQWGADEEADRMRAIKRRDFDVAARVLGLSSATPT